MELDDAEEYEIFRSVYQDNAKLNGAPSLRAYEVRARRFTRIAEHFDDPKKTELRDRAAIIHADIRATQARARSIVVRRRAAKAFSGWHALRLYTVAAICLVGFGWSTDYLDYQHSGSIATVKSCSEAIKATKDAKEEALKTRLPSRCKPTPPAARSGEVRAR